MKSARSFIEIAKAVGYVDIVSGVRLATLEFLRDQLKSLPRVLEVAPGYKIEFFKDVSFEGAPFWFFIEPETEGGQVKFYSAPNEISALCAIETSMALGRSA
jgi:hypothetical protein